MHLTAFLFSFQTLRVRLQKPKHPVHVAKSRESLDASTSTAHTANGKRRRSDATKDDVPSDAADKKRAKVDDGDKSPEDAAAAALPDRRRSPPGVSDEHYALISASEHPLHPDHNASPLFELGAIPSWDLAGAGSWRHGPGSVCSGMQSSFMGGFPGDYASLGPGMGGAFSFENAHDDTVYPPHPEGDAAAEIGPSPRSILLRNGERRRSGHVHFEGGRQPSPHHYGGWGRPRAPSAGDEWPPQYHGAPYGMPPHDRVRAVHRPRPLADPSAAGYDDEQHYGHGAYPPAPYPYYGAPPPGAARSHAARRAAPAAPPRRPIHAPPGQPEAVPPKSGGGSPRVAAGSVPSPASANTTRWDPSEDARLQDIMRKNRSPKDWAAVARRVNALARHPGEIRGEDECRERWTKFLKPGSKKGQVRCLHHLCSVISFSNFW